MEFRRVLFRSLPLAANRARFSELVEQVLAYARSIGASDAVAEVSESLGLSVSVRKDDIETVEQTRDRSLDLTVYAGQSRGSARSEEHTSELQSLMRISYAVFCLKKKKHHSATTSETTTSLI